MHATSHSVITACGTDSVAGKCSLIYGKSVFRLGASPAFQLLCLQLRSPLGPSVLQSNVGRFDCYIAPSLASLALLSKLTAPPILQTLPHYNFIEVDKYIFDNNIKSKLTKPA